MKNRPEPHRTLARVGRVSAAAALSTLLLLTTACGDDDAESKAPVTTTTVADTPGTTVGHEGRDPVEVTAVDFSFEGLPSTIEAGSRLTLRNEAPKELHELVAFRLPDDEKRSVKEILQLPEAEVGKLLAMPTTVLLAAPGADQISAVGDGTISEPGRYLVMCAIPTGVDPATYLKAAAASGGEKPDVAGGPPHFVSGMVAELTVT